MSRTSASFKLRVGHRVVTVKAMDAVGPEDYYDVALRAVLHRFVTGEDAWAPASREIKDWCIRSNLYV